MSLFQIKKNLFSPLFLILFLSVICNKAFALTQIPFPMQTFSQRWYAGFLGGYSYSNWTGFEYGPFATLSSGEKDTRRRGREGFAFGVVVGYQFSHLLSAEFNIINLPRVIGRDASNLTINVRSWLSVLFIRASFPIFTKLFHAQKVRFFAKLGAGARSLSYSGAGANGSYSEGVSHYFTPVLAVGGVYRYDENSAVNLQYIYIPSRTSASNVKQQAPSASLFLAGVSYYF